MKKVKIMLTAVAVMAVVGGALAFKAVKGQHIFCDSQAKPGVCDVQINNFSVTPQPAQQSVGSSTCTITSDPGADCQLRPTYVNF